jgi:hypothetical protein
MTTTTIIRQSNLIGTGHLTSVSCLTGEKTRHFLSSLIVLAAGDDPTRLIEHFNLYCYENYHAAPVVVFGTLEQAMNDAFNAQSIGDVRLALNV